MKFIFKFKILSLLLLSTFLFSCSKVRESAGVTRKSIDEFQSVENAPLVIPPDFNLTSPDKIQEKDIDDVETIYHWLASNIPKENFYSLVHNDYKLDNAMFSFNDPTKMIAVFDWDMCTLGDPLCDLGSLLSYWKDPDDPSFFRDLSMMPKDGIFLKRDELIKIYAQYSGFDVKNIVFYHVLGLFKLIGIIAQIYVRYIRGQTKDKRFANFGDAIPFIARFAINVSKK